VARGRVNEKSSPWAAFVKSFACIVGTSGKAPMTGAA